MLMILLCEYTYLAFCLLAMKYFWQSEMTKKIWRYVAVILAIGIVSLLEVKLNMEEVLIYPVEIVCILFLIKGKKFLSFIQFLVTDIIWGLLQRIGVYIIIAIGKSTYLHISDRGLEKLFLRLLTLLLILLFRKKLEQYSYYLKKLTWYHIVLCIAMEICVVFIVAQAEIGMFFNGKEIANNITMGLVLLACFIILIVIIIFIIVDINRKHYQEQNTLKDKYLTIQERYYKTLVHKDEEVKKARHDLRAHLGCIEGLLEKGNYEEADRYIKKLKNDTIKRIDTPYKSGNNIINAVLNDVAETAMKHNTKIIFIGSLPPNIKIESPELCSLFYNLLSNGEEAMEKYKGDLPREIHMEISLYKRSMEIKIENPVMKSVDINKLGKYTSKQDKELHGYGIENIREIVEKYNGILEFENRDGYFVCKIVFANIINE